MTIGLKAKSGALLTLTLSFNNRGPFGSFYRYIGDSGTYHVFRDELTDHYRKPIPLKGSAFVDQNQNFLMAIRGEALPTPTPADILPTMRLIDQIDKLLLQ